MMFSNVENLGERTQNDNMCVYIELKVGFVYTVSMLTTWRPFVKHLEFKIKNRKSIKSVGQLQIYSKQDMTV